jgi:inhibitor of KinA
VTEVGPPSIGFFGDAALLVSYEERIDPEINDLVHALAALVRADRQAGAPWAAPVPAYASVLVPFEPLSIDPADARARLETLVAGVTAAETEPDPRPTLEIPVRYGGEHGPDLNEVAELTGLTPVQVIELHCGPTYRAYLLGFAPGFAYLGTLPEELRLPRRPTPRAQVAAGSVAIAGAQTAVYPLATPGGWHLLGRTELALWDLALDPPTLIEPGRRVRFRPLDG